MDISDAKQIMLGGVDINRDAREKKEAEKAAQRERDYWRDMYTRQPAEFRELLQEAGHCKDVPLEDIRKAWADKNEAELGRLMRNLLDYELENAVKRMTE